MKWSNFDFKTGRVDFLRAKGSLDGHHGLRTSLKKVLMKLKKNPKNIAEHIFITEGGDQMKARNVQMLMKKLGKLAGLQVDFHPHMLRHSMGYHLANSGKSFSQIQYYLGYRDPKHTCRYIVLNKKNTEGLLDDLPSGL